MGEKKSKDQLIKKELESLFEQKKGLVNQVNQLQQAIKNGEENLRHAIDAHNRTQAQIDILEKVLK